MRIKKLLASFFLTCILQASPALYGEILEVTVIWNSASCPDHCAKLIQKKFESMPQVNSVVVNTGSGTANLKWNPKSPFSYQMIKSQLQMVGIGLVGMRLRVRGHAIPKENGAVLSSIGDQTEFILLSPIRAPPGDYIALPDGSTLSLSPGLQQKILNASKENKVIVAEGSLYQGHRSPPLYLMVNRLQIEKGKNPDTHYNMPN